MFDFEGREVLRGVDPPRAVEVDLHALWPPLQGIRWGRQTPLWVKAGGVDVAATVPARLTHWLLTNTGDWLGIIDGLQLPARNGLLDVELGPMAVRAAALRPR